MKKFVSVFLSILAVSLPAASAPEYSIQAIRYASAEDEVAGLVMGAPKGEKIEIAMVIWLVRGGGHNILFDSGYHRDTFLKYFPSTDYIRPDEAVKLGGVKPEEVTDIVISHAHWDHLGGIDLFPKATVWIQKEEYRYYTGEAWQAGGNHGGIDPEDVKELVRLNTEGRVRLVDGDNVELFPGIRAYTGARHTYASQYLRIEGNPPFVLASDNCYLYRNLAEHKASATFSDEDHAANIKNQERMIQLAGGSPDRVIPGHDALQFQKYPTQGRVATIQSGEAQHEAQHHEVVAQRGDEVMGFSHEKTTHHFRLYPDGGAIEVTANKAEDTESRDAIRGHLGHIVTMFAAGNFSAPMLIHSQNPPGTAEMKRLQEAIQYKLETTDRGARIRITTKDPDALRAVHKFLRFQISDHQTGDTTEVTKVP